MFSAFSSLIKLWCLSIDRSGNVTKKGNQHISKTPRIIPTVLKAFFSRRRLCNLRFIICNSSFADICELYCEGWGFWRTEFRFNVEYKRLPNNRFARDLGRTFVELEFDVSSSGLI